MEENIESYVLPNAGQKFKGNDFRDLRKPGVYVLLVKGKPLYVGMASMLLRRIGGKHSQADKAMALCDEVLLYPCVSVKAAVSLESILIRKLQPQFNIHNRSSILRKKLGLGYGQANNIRRNYASRSQRNSDEL